MNALLSLVRLSINLCDRPADWATIVTRATETEPGLHTLDEPAQVLENGERIYSLRKHPVPPRQNGAPATRQRRPAPRPAAAVVATAPGT